AYGCTTAQVQIVSLTPDLDPGGPDSTLYEIWWPQHTANQPGIRLTRDAAGSGDDGGLGAGEWALGDPNYQNRVGEQVGRTMYVDYPAGGRAVIYAEGNIRIKGRLPQGNYHLTVVSGGTIYIDGQILSPQDQGGRDADGPGGTYTGVTDEENTYIALLARDCVVVNPTMLVPQFDKRETTVVAQDDPGENYPPGKHWQMPPSNGGVLNYTQSQFYFGAQPTGDVKLCAYQGLKSEDGGVTSTTLALAVGAGIDIIDVDPDVSSWIPATHKLLIIHGGNPALKDEYNFTEVTATQIRLAPPTVRAYPMGSEVINLSLGPPDVTGISLAAYNPVSGWVPYDFDIPPFSASPPESIFVLTRKYLGPYFEPPWVWEGSSLWAPLHDTYWPWLLNGYIDPGAGALNALRFVMPTSSLIDTANGGNSNVEPYLLKKFKLHEYDAIGSITGSIHAKINAVMYAQDGCFFVIPGRYFKEDVLGPDVKAYLRYNYDVEIRGAITENFHPGPAVVREWQEKWAYPAGAEWNSIRYIYDETLLAARTQPLTTLSGANVRSSLTASWHSNTVKVPLLPASPDLLYYGEVR
ncbi:MAG: hypothetical protein KAW89_07005, partial [Armatimonadetes bacterium]|nr:hypothetical protein [Armatimonadota bacterium]